jgi:hypothetical protein
VRGEGEGAAWCMASAWHSSLQTPPMISDAEGVACMHGACASRAAQVQSLPSALPPPPPDARPKPTASALLMMSWLREPRLPPGLALGGMTGDARC